MRKLNAFIPQLLLEIILLEEVTAQFLLSIFTQQSVFERL